MKVTLTEDEDLRSFYQREDGRTKAEFEEYQWLLNRWPEQIPNHGMINHRIYQDHYIPNGERRPFRAILEPGSRVKFIALEHLWVH